MDAPPADLADELVKAVGVGVSLVLRSCSVMEIKFDRSPWWPTGEETVATRLLLLTLLETLERFGFTLDGSINQENSKEGHDADVLIVHRHRSWIPGMSIWHR